MLWRLSPEQFDRLSLGAAALLTVLFAAIALELAFAVL
jgi:hypothetical protein